MIKAENISYSINNMLLLDQISLAFQPNEISMILGPNGAGKSTLIKILSKQIKPNKGRVITNGNVLQNISQSELAKTQAVLSQNIHMVFPMKVEEVVMMGRYPHFSSKAESNDKEIVLEAMKLFQVDEMAQRNYLTLSGGEKQRVHFARVAAQVWPDGKQQLKILLLDEPLTFLDINYQLDFMKKLKVMMNNQPMTVIGVVHDLNLAYKYSDQVIFLKSGKVFSQGRKEDVFTTSSLKEVFNLNAKFILNEGVRHLLF
ncbi:MAG: heme ABC transporter ATP-binding protein [Flavobacteriales bacterium]|nr:heme ABC transporter ATP-binding protein [Flavobacteriales bacterium]|tara:strand:+ start:23295 stop:24068 length:774 start_codon:yes stop_codon:yes gene_type:complete